MNHGAATTSEVELNDQRGICENGIWTHVDPSGVAWVEIDRPDRMNALDGGATERIRGVMEEWSSDPAVRAVVIGGRGGSFCAGADITAIAAGSGGSLEGEAARRVIASGSDLVRAVRAVPVPVVAAVDGAAVGIGASLAVAADLVYATDRSYFLLAFVNIGLMPDGAATMLFAESVGRARANEMALLGEKMPAAEAYRSGLLSGVVADADELSATIDKVTGKLAKRSSAALRLTKAALDAHNLAGFEDAIERELTGQTELLQSPAFTQTMAAFSGGN